MITYLCLPFSIKRSTIFLECLKKTTRICRVIKRLQKSIIHLFRSSQIWENVFIDIYELLEDREIIRYSYALIVEKSGFFGYDNASHHRDLETFTTSLMPLKML